MELIIDIPEEKYKTIQEGMYCGMLDVDLYRDIKNGTPLPKGHGRLIDADERRKEIDEKDRWVVDLAETIIEADKKRK